MFGGEWETHLVGSVISPTGYFLVCVSVKYLSGVILWDLEGPLPNARGVRSTGSCAVEIARDRISTCRRRMCCNGPRLGMLQSASFGQVFTRHGLSWGEYVVLAALRRAGPPYQMSPTALYGAVILSSGGITKRLDRLEQAGLVERIPDPADRRGGLVALTDKGRERVDRAVIEHLDDDGSAAERAVRGRAAGAGEPVEEASRFPTVSRRSIAATLPNDSAEGG